MVQGEEEEKERVKALIFSAMFKYSSSADKQWVGMWILEKIKVRKGSKKLSEGTWKEKSEWSSEEI